MDPIIIIGSGLGGLAFAQALRKASIPFRVFERDQISNFRGQGYRIRLHGEGLHALRSVSTDEVWELFEQTCPACVLGPLPHINALTCDVSAANFGGSNPQARLAQSDMKPHTVDRAVLREVLLTGLGSNITYGKEYAHYTTTDSGVIAHFTDGSSVAGSLLVGADGVHSAVRRQHVPSIKILDTGSRPVYGKTPLTPTLERRILPKILECMSFIKDSQVGSTTLVETIRFLPKEERTDKRDLPDNYIYWVIIPPSSNAGEKSPVELAKSLTAHWDPSVRALIEHQDASQTHIFRLLSSDPASIAKGWSPDARVTVLGDAAHAMLPTAANGAVTALRDARLLSSLIQEHGVGEESVSRFEEEMRKYASDAVAGSAELGENIFGFGSLADAVEISS